MLEYPSPSLSEIADVIKIIGSLELCQEDGEPLLSLSLSHEKGGTGWLWTGKVYVVLVRKERGRDRLMSIFSLLSVRFSYYVYYLQ